MYRYNAMVVRVIDGDTVILAVDLGFRLTATYRFRIRDLDTPEIYGVKKDSMEYVKGKAASDYAKTILPQGLKVKLRSSMDPGIYGRYSADIYVIEHGSILFSQVMKDAGYHKEKGA